jgi:hypothetical protein
VDFALRVCSNLNKRIARVSAFSQRQAGEDESMKTNHNLPSCRVAQASAISAQGVWIVE